MILHGDELGRTQQGNNNTYAQDSELSWVHWDAADLPLTEFVSAVARLRKDHPTFRRKSFFDGRPVRRGAGEPLADIVWLTPGGEEMEPDNWGAGFGRAIGVFLNGNGIQGRDDRGARITDLHFAVFFNAGDGNVDFVLPSEEFSGYWEIVIDTSGELADSAPRKAGDRIPIMAKSLVVLRAWTAVEIEVDHSVAASLSAQAATQSSPARRPEVG
jgi:glycogen operon protein